MPSELEHVILAHQFCYSCISHGRIPKDTRRGADFGRPIEHRQDFHKRLSRWNVHDIMIEIAEIGSEEVFAENIQKHENRYVCIGIRTRVTYCHMTTTFVSGTEIVRWHINSASQDSALRC